MIAFGPRPSAVPSWRRLQDALLGLDGPAPCRSDPDTWWSSDAEVAEMAAHLCGRCPVIVQCNAFATANRERSGIWAGRSRTPTLGRPAAQRQEIAR